MIPEKLTMHNFMSYQNPEPLDFLNFQLVCLSGENGVGKSSILEAISWTLWGKSRAVSDDDLINQDKDEMWVELIFKIDNQTYKVIRKRIKKKRGFSELYLYSFSKKSNGFHTMSEDTIAATQKKIEQILKIPYRVFTNSAYLRQGKADEFTTKTPTERKEILAEILDLKMFDEYSKKAREKSKISKNTIESLILQIEELKNELLEEKEIKKEYLKNESELIKINKIISQNQKELDQLQIKVSKIEILNQKNENLNENLNRIISEGKSLKDDKNKLDAEIKNIQLELKAEDKVISNVKKLQKYKKINDKYNSKQIKVLEFNQKLAILNNDKNKIVNQINKISHISKCPTCTRVLTKKESKKIIDNFKNEINKNIDPQIKNIDLKIKQINYNKEKHLQIKNNLDILQKYEEKLNNIIKNKAVLDEKQKLKIKLSLEIDKKKEEYLEIIKKIKQIEYKIKKLEPYYDKFNKIKTKADELSNTKLNISENLAAVNQKLKQIKYFQENLNRKQNQYNNNKRDYKIYLELADIFSKRGIQARILESAIPEIENQANKILEKLSNGKMQVSLITQREKKTSEELIETLDIQIKDNLGIRKYEMFSGGEAFRINFALRIALSRFLAQKSGTKLQFLAIDEGFGTQDSRGKTLLVEAINNISDYFKKILVITHDQELRDAFDTRIDVFKDENGSNFKIVY